MRTQEVVSKSLSEAKVALDQGIESGKYTRPSDTQHWDWKSGQAYNRMTSYISDLKTELNEILSQHCIDIKMDNDYVESPEFTQHLKDTHNAGVADLAEIVYNHYLPQGHEIAIERKNLYLQKNLK